MSVRLLLHPTPAKNIGISLVRVNVSKCAELVKSQTINLHRPDCIMLAGQDDYELKHHESQELECAPIRTVLEV